MNFLGDTEIAGTKEEHDHAVVSRRRIKKPLHRLAPNPPVMPMSSLIASLNNSAPALGSTPALQAAVGVIGLPLNASTYGNEPDFREETSENSFMLTHAMSHGMPQTSSLSQLHATRACEPVAPSLNLEPALGPHASYVSDTSLGINTGFDRDANLAPNAGYGINHGLTTYNTQASSMRISHSNPASYPMPALPHNLPTNIGLATVDPTLQLDEPVDASYTAAQGYTGPLSNAADMLAVSAFSSTPSSLVYRGYPIPGSDALFQAPIQPTVRSPAMALSHLARPAFTQDVAQPATTQTDGAKIFNRTKRSKNSTGTVSHVSQRGSQEDDGSNPDAFFWLVSNGETQFTIAADFNFSRDLTEKTGGVKANTLTKTGSVVAKTMSARFGEQKRNMAEIKKRDEGLPQAQKWLRSDVRNTADHWQRTSNTAHDVRLRDLGAGVIHFPTGNDRGIITQCIQFAKQTQDDSLMLSQVLQVAAQQGFVSPFPVRRGVSTVNQVI
ncbi:hypothetical protein H2203_008584 [Taxawa tesnikishii (nom. ined.)]|nr:hypothetical protein H2203_008584 [Dothideales sp. JES 119]